MIYHRRAAAESDGNRPRRRLRLGGRVGSAAAGLSSASRCREGSRTVATIAPMPSIAAATVKAVV
jgi:hypothetical protein